MFKQSRRKIVAAILSSLTLLWIGTLTGIYVFSYFEMAEQNKGMLTEYARQYVLPRPLEEPPQKMMEPKMERPRDFNLPLFLLSTFYSAAIADNGEVLEIRNPQKTVRNDEEIERIARAALAGHKTTGVKQNLVYYVVDKGGYWLVVLKDNTIMNESRNTLFRYTLIFGALAIVFLCFIAAYLAKRIVLPLEESYQKQKQFISDAGHELKTPISVVNANAELLSRELKDNQWLSNIQYETERMGVLVTQLLALSRLENVAPQMEPLDLTRLVEGEALPFEGVAFENGFPLRCDIAKQVTVVGNGMQMRQLVSILLDNAIRHGERGKEIFLSLQAERGFAVISVVNAGEEIPREQRERLFERFYRIDSVRNGDDGHYGLGLAIAKVIAESHGGKINVRCNCGQIEFFVRVPLGKIS